MPPSKVAGLDALRVIATINVWCAVMAINNTGGIFAVVAGEGLGRYVQMEHLMFLCTLKKYRLAHSRCLWISNQVKLRSCNLMSFLKAIPAGKSEQSLPLLSPTVPLLPQKSSSVSHHIIPTLRLQQKSPSVWTWVTSNLTAKNKTQYKNWQPI